MKAKDLTQADVGKWVTLRAKIEAVSSRVEDLPNTFIEIEGDLDPDGIQGLIVIWPETPLEFTTPPPPVQEVGDVFQNLGGTPPREWTISAIDGNACIMRYLTGHVSADYPLNPTLWEFVRKGNVA